MSKRAWFKVVLLGFIVPLAACSDIGDAQDNDPLEPLNRKTHAFNTSLDRNVLRPVSLAYVNYVNDDVRAIFGNMSDNLKTPLDVANNILQGKLDMAVENSVKFVVNSTIGICGLGTPAQDLGIDGDETDFGETLHLWDVAEGPYIVLPLLGPSTGRDAVGRVADVALNPLRTIPSEELSVARSGFMVTDGLNARGEFDDTISELMHESTDSYEQLKLFYLQSRRFELDGISDDDYIDPYDDLFGDE